MASYLPNLDQVKGFTTTAWTQLRQKAGFVVSNMEDFAPLFELNDRVRHEILDQMTEQEIANYDLVPPQVCVVGLTSAGKSSLLEGIAKQKIFPVLDGVCTRQPFQLSVKRLQEGESGFGHPEDTKSTASAPTSTFKFHKSNKVFKLPAQTEAVRAEIARLQGCHDEKVAFSKEEIRATIFSANNETFTFTDLPGVFLLSETQLSSSAAKSKQLNAALRKETLRITEFYVKKPNTIVLLVISASDWMHSMNNDPFISELATWLEEARKTHSVDVYGVITKIDMQEKLSKNSPLYKIFTDTLPETHILRSIKVKKWIPCVSSPDVLGEADSKKSEQLEIKGIRNCLVNSGLKEETLMQIPMGRPALLRELKVALLKAISKTQKGLRKRLMNLRKITEKKLKGLPRPMSIHEKRQIFDRMLKSMEQKLKELIGVNGSTTTNSLRMHLMVRAPNDFENDMLKSSLRGNVMLDVTQIINQAEIEMGGNFESRTAFDQLGKHIIDSYEKPCHKLVGTFAGGILRALKVAVDESFGEYKLLKTCIEDALGLPDTVDVDTILKNVREQASTGEPSQLGKNPELIKMFPTLERSAMTKVDSLIDAHRTMVCFHPMWRNFNDLYNKILVDKKSDQKSMSAYQPQGETTLQDMLGLDELRRRVKSEGLNAIRTFEQSKSVHLSNRIRERILRHFARVEVMGYIIRMNLRNSVFPIIVRDLREGVFRGIKGVVNWDQSVAEVLRTKLLFNPKNEAKIMPLLDPSPEDTEKRKRLVKKVSVMTNLEKEFVRCEGHMKTLEEIFSKET